MAHPDVQQGRHQSPRPGPSPRQGDGYQNDESRQAVLPHHPALQVSPALQPVDPGAEKAGAPEPVEDPADQQQDKGHRHHIAQDGHQAGRGRGESRRHSHRNGAPELQHRHHSGAEGQQDRLHQVFLYGHGGLP